MFAGMRTGSNFLEASLNALPGVVCHGEAFNAHFIGKLNQDMLHDVSLAQRDADPGLLLRRMRERTAGLAGFRFFHDHDPRVFQSVMADPRCAKIVLTRNPLESYISWKIVGTTGQWRLINARRLRTATVRFVAAEFETHLARQQAFHARVLHGLQSSGQTAFWLDYEDLRDVDVLNGLAAWLGISGRLPAPADALKKQNPGALTDKVDNPEEMALALARLDRFSITRIPNFEPRHAPAIPGFAASGPILHMPVPGGPAERVAGWLQALGPLQGDFTDETLHQWRRAHPGHRSLTVLRHPVARAHAAFAGQVLTGALPDVRGAFQRTMQITLPFPKRLRRLCGDDYRAAFLAFLRFAKLNLSGQTAAQVDVHVASQSAILQGFAPHGGPDLVLREDRLAEGLAFAASEAGIAAPPLPDAPPPVFPYDAEIEAAAQDAYGRDYFAFGFGAWR